MNVGFISLGCSKNLVDTEMMIGLFKRNGYSIVNDPASAEIIVINTCGFIGPAKEEAINIILEGRGTQFDPLLADLFVEAVREIN